ncbi:MAG: L-lactate dehydrogenase [Crocinitomicaceae bacterium]|jgi:L-lactate dehydrogenase
MIDVTVIGFGSVGSALSLLLLNNKNDMRVNILEPDPNKEGAILDLLHGMSLYPNKELHVNDSDMFANADFIYFTAGTPNLHGGSRLSTAKQNIQLTKDLFDGQEFHKIPYIIVITNPVDIISYHVMKFSKLPYDHVVGVGTFLDSVRLSYYLSILSDYKADEINAYVLGEHGDTQFAAYSMTKVQGSPISELAFFSPKRLEEAQTLTRNAAFQIRKTQGGTLYGVSKCAETILNSLMSSEVSHYPLSILTNEYYNKLLKLEKSIYISVPVEISNKGIRINNGIQLKDSELKAYQASAKIISEVLLT